MNQEEIKKHGAKTSPAEIHEVVKKTYIEALDLILKRAEECNIGQKSAHLITMRVVSLLHTEIFRAILRSQSDIMDKINE